MKRPLLKKLLHASLPLLAASSFLASNAHPQVTPQRLLDSAKEPQNWLMYSGDYSGHRFSTLDQINSSNANALVPKWAYQTMAGGKFETTPLVVDGILYATGQDNRAFALDAKSGRPIWQYQRALPADIRPCCGRVNRGLAILGDKVFFGTLDTHVVALDSKTGNVVWDATAFVIWLLTFGRNSIRWRNVDYRIQEGMLVPATSSPAQNSTQ